MTNAARKASKIDCEGSPTAPADANDARGAMCTQAPTMVLPFTVNRARIAGDAASPATERTDENIFRAIVGNLPETFLGNPSCSAVLCQLSCAPPRCLAPACTPDRITPLLLRKP